MLDPCIFLRLFVGVIAGADHGATFDDTETDAQAELFPVGKFIRMHPAINRQVLLGGLEILADRYDVGIVGHDVAEGLLDLMLFFAEAEHDAGLGREAAALGVLEHGAAAFVTGLHTHGFLQAFDGFEIVIKNVGFGVEHGVEIVEATFPIRSEHFDRAVGILVAHRADRGGPDRGATVFQFVAGNRGDHTVAQTHLGDGVGDASGFAEVELGGAAGLDRAEVAGARANVTEDHHRGRAARPAFAEVGALGALANGVEFVGINQLAHCLIAGTGGELGTEPGRFAGGIHRLARKHTSSRITR